MSKIEAHVSELTEIKPKRKEERQDYLRRLIAAGAELPDDDWSELSKEEQDWINTGADAINAKAQTLPEPPDAAKAEEPAPSGRRSRAAKAEDPVAPAGLKEISVDDIDVGMALKVVTKRNKEYSGHVTEAEENLFVLKLGNGDEEELDYDRIEKAWTLGDAGSADGGASEDADPLAVGNEVIITNKRGKVYTGEVIELDDKIVVLKTDDGDEEINLDRIGSVEPVNGGSKSTKAEEPAPSGRRSRAAKAEDPVAPEKPQRSRNEGGVGVGARIREIMCAAGAEGITLEAVDKQLTKEGVNYREASSRMIYKDVTHVLELLKKAKRLK